MVGKKFSQNVTGAKQGLEEAGEMARIKRSSMARRLTFTLTIKEVAMCVSVFKTKLLLLSWWMMGMLRRKHV